MQTRSYTVVDYRDHISGFDHRLLLTGQPVGGYAALNNSFGGKFLHHHHAVRAGELFVELGLLPCHQTDERVAQYREANEAARPAVAA